MSRVRTSSDVAPDWTKCFAYEELTQEEIEHYSNIEITEDLKEGGIHANRAWERWYQFLASCWKTDLGTEIARACEAVDNPSVLSLGCGYGGMELEVARKLKEPYHILALDVNDTLFPQARKKASERGLSIEFQAIDLNFADMDVDSFDVVFAHASLHHLLNFEHLFEQIYHGLREGGKLIVLDIIGKTQVLFWPENIEFAARLVRRMPERYRAGLDTDTRSLFAGYLEGADQQGMEGIRQEELEGQIERYFRRTKMFKYNAFVRLICTHPVIAERIDPDVQEDGEYLDGLFRLDLETIERGQLRPTEMFAVFERKDADALETVGPCSVAANVDSTSSDGTRADKVSVVLLLDGERDEWKVSLRSILVQTHRPLEVLVPVGAQEQRDWLEEVRRSSNVSEVRLVDCDRQQLRSRTAQLNRAIEACTGDFVALLHGQDAWYPIKLAEQVRFLQRRANVGLVYAQSLVVDERGRRTARVFGTDTVGLDISSAPIRLQFPRRAIPRSSVLFRRECWSRLGVFDEALLDWEEEFSIRVAAHGSVGFIGRPLGMYRVGKEDSEDRAERELLKHP